MGLVIEAGSFSTAGTGATALSLSKITGVPKGIIFFSGGKFGVNETTNARLGHGFSDDTYQWAATMLRNSSNYFSRMYPGSDSFVVLDGASGNPAVRGDVTSFAAGQVNLNITNHDSSFQVGCLVFAES